MTLAENENVGQTFRKSYVIEIRYDKSHLILHHFKVCKLTIFVFYEAICHVSWLAFQLCDQCSLYFMMHNLLQNEEPDEDEIFALVSSLKKVAIFFSCHNLGPWNLWDPLFNAIRDARDENQTMPIEVSLQQIIKHQS